MPLIDIFDCEVLGFEVGCVELRQDNYDFAWMCTWLMAVKNWWSFKIICLQRIPKVLLVAELTVFYITLAMNILKLASSVMPMYFDLVLI
jgi:hypothetical protein